MFVYDRSYQHTTIYYSYDLELAAKLIKTIKFENTSTTYSLTGKLSYDLTREDDKNMLDKMLVAHLSDQCSSAPLTQYKNNQIYQEITEEDKFTDNKRDERIYIDMRRSKSYNDELEKINRDDSGIPLTIKKQPQKNYDLELLVFLKQNICTCYQIRAILCHIKFIIFQK